MRNLTFRLPCSGLSSPSFGRARGGYPIAGLLFGILLIAVASGPAFGEAGGQVSTALAIETVPLEAPPPSSEPAEPEEGEEAERPLLPIEPAAPTELIGTVRVHYVKEGETLLDIARDNRLGILEVMAANPDKDPWVPGKGSLIILPTYRILPDAPARGVIVNLAERRLYFFDDAAGEVLSLPIGIGREGFTTPLGSTKIVRKKAHPIWYPTAATKADSPELPDAVAAGPDNPLGDYALYLGWPTYAIHGTNKPWGVGRQVSRGCIRLYPEDIEFLFGRAAVGTPVTVVNQPVKFAWKDDRLFMEIHPSRDQLDALEQDGRFPPEAMPGLMEMAQAALGDGPGRLDLAAIAHAERERRGVPVVISVP
jgi:L,D-transpeptidase ErfK/SrfK